MATFAERLRELRKKNNVTQSQLAEKLGVASVTVSIWERGVRRPEFETLDTIIILTLFIVTGITCNAVIGCLAYCVGVVLLAIILLPHSVKKVFEIVSITCQRFKKRRN